MSYRFILKTLANHVKPQISEKFFHNPMVSVLKSSSVQAKLRKMKISGPCFCSLLTPGTKRLCEMFKKYGFEVRMAGGAVRDVLMDKNPVDIDFATTATPQQMADMFTAEGIRMLNKNGEKHGTVTVRINEDNYEITTLRIDMMTNGRHADVQFTTNWELDAARRDLTVNAMFLGSDGMLYDYFNGIEHVKKRQVSFVGDAASRIKEDYLRILRYFRFYGRISVCADFHDADTLNAIRENMDGLQMISGERIWIELKKIMTGNYSKEIMLRMIDLGIAPFIGLPTYLDKKNTTEFHDVCERSKNLQPNAVTLLTALLKNEEEVSAFHSRVKMSKYDKDLANFIVNNRGAINEVTDTLVLCHDLVLTSKNKQSDVKEWACELAKYIGDAFVLERLKSWVIPKFPMNGHILMKQGVKEGPQLQEALSKLKKKWILSRYELSQDQLLKQLPSVVKVK